MLLYLHTGIWACLAANGDGTLDPATLILSLAIGAAAMPPALLLLIIQPRMRYPDVDPPRPSPIEG